MAEKKREQELREKARAKVYHDRFKERQYQYEMEKYQQEIDRAGYGLKREDREELERKTEEMRRVLKVKINREFPGGLPTPETSPKKVELLDLMAEETLFRQRWRNRFGNRPLVER